MAERSLVRLDGAASAAMKAALRAASLPVDDLEERLACYELRDADGDGALGWAALDRCDDDALLRSVVVPSAGQVRGVGSDLIIRLTDVAVHDGIRRLWLLTETAEPFFARLGFEPVSREEAPATIRQTSEFKSVCPVSAACMMLQLA